MKRLVENIPKIIFYYRNNDYFYVEIMLFSYIYTHSWYFKLLKCVNYYKNI